MLGLWLLGVSSPLKVVAQAPTLRTARDLLALFHPDGWPGFVCPTYVEVEAGRDALVLDLPDLLITSCPTQHLIPSMALKFVDKASGHAVVYSSDTSPTESLARFARASQVLIHEASGAEPGHSSAGEAGWVARRAGVDKLYIIHYPAASAGLDGLLGEARRQFAGPAELARDLDAFQF
jgi:ribonuclease Z